MKKIFTNSPLYLVLFTVLVMASCKREELKDVLTKDEGAKVSLTLPEMIEVSGGTNYTIDNSQLIVPVKVDFNGASTQAFTIQTTVNTDTVESLIADQKLPEGTIALEEGSFDIPPVVNVAYGVNSVSFNVIINRTFLEKNYGKDVGFAVKMSDAAKGNMLANGKSTTVVLIKTGATIAPEDLHRIKFAGTRIKIYPAGPEPGFTLGSQDITIPLELTLSGQAGASFNLDLVKSAEIVNEALNNGTLTNAVALSTSLYSTTASKATFSTESNTSSITLGIRKDAVVFATGKRIAVGLKLQNPSRWQLAESNTSIIVVIDPAYFGRAPFKGTPFLIKGTIGEESEFIPASNYDLGGEGVAYHDNGGRDGGQFRRPDQVDIADNNIVVGWTATGEWLSYTVNVEASGEYEMNALIGTPDGNRLYSVFSGIRNLTGGTLVPKNTGSHGNQQDNLTMVHLDAGLQVIRFYMDNANYDFRGFIFTRKQ